MNTSLGHIQFNVEAANIGFYKDLLTFLGWSVLHEAEGMLGLGDSQNLSVWFSGYVKEGVKNDYDGPGINHIALHTKTQADVDATAEHLREHGVELLFETPRHRPEFSDENSTYYQVMFETPDRLLFEVVYIGPKA